MLAIYSIAWRTPDQRDIFIVSVEHQTNACLAHLVNTVSNLTSQASHDYAQQKTERSWPDGRSTTANQTTLSSEHSVQSPASSSLRRHLVPAAISIIARSSGVGLATKWRSSSRHSMSIGAHRLRKRALLLIEHAETYPLSTSDLSLLFGQGSEVNGTASEDRPRDGADCGLALAGSGSERESLCLTVSLCVTSGWQLVAMEIHLDTHQLWNRSIYARVSPGACHSVLLRTSYAHHDAVR